MLKVYVAGSLFNEAEVAQRKKEGEILRATFPQLDIFNPIDQPFNENKPVSYTHLYFPMY